MSVNFKACLMAVTLSAASSMSVAGPWLGFTKLTQVYPQANGLSVNTEHSFPDYSSCEAGRRFRVPIDHPNYEVMVETLVAGFIAGKEFNLNIHPETGNEPTCAPEIEKFRMR